jgi:hypothetical protein
MDDGKESVVASENSPVILILFWFGESIRFWFGESRDRELRHFWLSVIGYDKAVSP